MSTGALLLYIYTIYSVRQFVRVEKGLNGRKFEKLNILNIKKKNKIELFGHALEKLVTPMCW